MFSVDPESFIGGTEAIRLIVSVWSVRSEFTINVRHDGVCGYAGPPSVDEGTDAACRHWWGDRWKQHEPWRSAADVKQDRYDEAKELWATLSQRLTTKRQQGWGLGWPTQQSTVSVNHLKVQLSGSGPRSSKRLLVSFSF
ncbi:unnamed protein product [Strongylus vulgaris]|uniref:Uncharacterized protein n=1 Tax=Strongylus vulgaris TaxID=40348 RepID=A0A3P7IKN4_STRVU|nr:unnamed protein product [Strongylus vulgaris]